MDPIIALFLLLFASGAVACLAICKAAANGDRVMREYFHDDKDGWQRPPIAEKLLKNGGLR